MPLRRSGHGQGFTVGAHHPPRRNRRRARSDAAAGCAATPRNTRGRRCSNRPTPASFATRALREAIVGDVLLRCSSRSNLAAICAARRATARQERYSHVLVATEDPAGYRLAGAIGAPVRIGFADSLGKPLKSLWSRRFLTSTIYRSAGLDRRAPHECQVLFALGRPLLPDEHPTRDSSPSCGRWFSSASRRPTSASPCRSPTSGNGSA